MVFTSDGHPTDQYRDELGALRTEKWFSTAIKLAVSLGDNASIPDLGEIVDSPNSVIHAADQFGHALDGYVIGAVASLFLMEEGRTAISGRNLCERNDHERINEPLHWSLSEDGTLTVHGFIIPDSYTPKPDVPWSEHREEIKRVIVAQGVRIIGMHAFYDLPNLEAADISRSVTDIRCGAFANCPKLTSIKIGRNPLVIRDFMQIRLAPTDTVIVWPKAFANTACSAPDSWELANT